MNLPSYTKTSARTSAMQNLILPNARAATSSSWSAHPPPRCRKQPPSRVSVRASSASTAAPRRETDPRKRVVITGMGVVSVFGSDVDAYYARLLAGDASGVGPIDRFDTSTFSTRFAAQIRGFSPEGYVDGKDARRLDACHLYTVVAAKKALSSAALPPGSAAMEKLDKERAGVVIGSGMGGVGAFSDGVEKLVATNCRKKISPFCIPHAITNAGAAMVAMAPGVGFRGHNQSISTACATSNHCFHNAADQIRMGRADVVLAGGAEAAIVPIGLGGFAACRALSKRNDDPATASRPWDRDRDGFVMGEGAGILVVVFPNFFIS